MVFNNKISETLEDYDNNNKIENHLNIDDLSCICVIIIGKNSLFNMKIIDTIKEKIKKNY